MLATTAHRFWGLELNYYYRYEHNSPRKFIQDAKENVSRTEQSAEYISFSPYWYHEVSYYNLTPPQQKWYFYWRTQVRNGNFLKTDLSYLFLHAYETINLIGFERPQDAYEHLSRLWKHYRNLPVPQDKYVWALWSQQPYVNVPIHPVDRYFVDWIADFICIHKLPVDTLDWYSVAFAEGALLTDIDLMAEAWLNSGERPELLSLEMLFILAGYWPTHNKFYQEFATLYQLDKVYIEGFAAVNAFLARQPREKSLLRKFKVSRPRTIKRYPFERALHTYPLTRLPIVKVHSRANHEKLNQILRAIIKYTENIFRERAGFRAKLRDIDLPEDWKKALDRAFEIKPEPVVIDLNLAQKIEAKSEALRNRLIIEDDPGDAIKNASGTGQGEAKVQNEKSALIPSTLDRSFSEFGAVVKAEYKLFQLFQEHGWRASNAALQVAVPESFISVVLDQINEILYEYFDDIVFYQEDDLWIVAEDYREEVTRVLSETQQL